MVKRLRVTYSHSKAPAESAVIPLLVANQEPESPEPINPEPLTMNPEALALSPESGSGALNQRLNT